MQPKYYGFELDTRGDTTFGVEKLADMSDEIRPVHEEHYQETETQYLDHPFNPDYDRYIQLEDNQQFVLFTVRVDLEIAGYLQYYVFRDLHTQVVRQAREDALFIRKSYRGQKLAPRLLAYAEDALQRLGCSYVGMTSKGPVGAPDIGPFLESKGYRHVAEFYCKKLEN